MVPVLYLAAAYLCGSIPFSWILGRLKGVDLREHGSGNPGATNLLRTCGKGMGITGLLLDALKGAAPVYAALYHGPEFLWLPAAAVVMAVCGHVLMPWFGFRGGKGAATALGALLVLATLPVLCALGVFIVVVAVTRMISAGSVLGGLSLPVWGFVFSVPVLEKAVMLLLALAILVTHRSNIRRIIAGNERKLEGR
ncbi:acyl-phosphate glycerol 3-phosphate acyltransferase [Candidatus Fermentibacteria bacterium]|nr:MAG: acyl-phosphate glycerol 3-phosphate acyltransferase [Candidatus Fermentibacteria bacterium]